ncbi:MAG: alpha/beta hydrolase fold domain-containing protein [Pseudomonadota bacterium]
MAADTEYDPLNDERLDVRGRAMLAELPGPLLHQPVDVSSREEAIAVANAPDALAAEQQLAEMLEAMDDETVAPSEGLRISVETFVSQPDGNSINIQIIRPDTEDVLPCVYYIHGGAMMVMSALLGNYRAWGKLIARQNLCVAMVDFRNSLRPSSAEEVAPFPAGLNDCVSGYYWIKEHAASFHIDPAQVLIAGESGGGNLAIATTMKLQSSEPPNSLFGLYALCPYLLGRWPDDSAPSSHENEGILISVANNHATMAYGIDAFVQKNPLAWPAFASADHVAGFPPTMVSVNECDPLRDEGVAFYRLLQSAGVFSHCRQLMGTVHANELFSAAFPDLSRATARDIAGWVEECRYLQTS